MQIKYPQITKLFKNLLAGHFDDLVFYFYVFWGWEAQEAWFGDQWLRKIAIFKKFKCENFIC